mgnify:FL=1
MLISCLGLHIPIATPLATDAIRSNQGLAE